MRVILVGPEAARARLRAETNGSFAVVGEFVSLAAAREAALSADACLVSAEKTLDSQEPLVEPITPRELEVLELLAEGLSNKGIAARLGISDQTVKFHVAAISSKLGAHNRTEAVRQALRRGLITL